MSNNPFDQNFTEVVANSNSNYFKMPSLAKEGDKATIKIRIVQPEKAIAGWEWWTEVDGKRKPNRIEQYNSKGEALMPPKVLFEGEKKDNPKNFFAYIIYNYNTEKFETMQIHQKALKTAILDLAKNKDWGKIDGYNINITKTQTGKETQSVEYTVMPSPHSKLEKELQDELNNLNWDLNQLFVGKHPWDNQEKEGQEAGELPDIDTTINSVQMPF
jgi:hypothetical protein